METIVNTNNELLDALSKRPQMISQSDLKVLVDEINHPALFIDGQSSALEHGNVPKNGYRPQDIPKLGKILEIVENRIKVVNGVDILTGFVSKSNRTILWITITHQVKDLGKIVDINTTTGVITVYKPG